MEQTNKIVSEKPKLSYDELVKRLSTIQEQLYNSYGEVDESDLQEYEELNGELGDKLLAYKYMRSLADSHVQILKDQVENFNRKIKARQNTKDFFTIRAKNLIHQFGDIGKTGNYAIKLPNVSAWTTNRDSLIVKDNASLIGDIKSILNVLLINPDDENLKKAFQEYVNVLSDNHKTSINIELPLDKLPVLIKNLNKFFNGVSHTIDYNITPDKKAITDFMKSYNKANNENDNTEEVDNTEKVLTEEDIKFKALSNYYSLGSSESITIK